MLERIELTGIVDGDERSIIDCLAGAIARSRGGL